MQRDFGGVIWTNHVIERMEERHIKQGDAWATWKRPDNSEYDKSNSVWIYQRNYPEIMIEVVAKRNDKGKWIILSVWDKKLKPSKSVSSKKSLLQLIRELILPKK